MTLHFWRLSHQIGLGVELDLGAAVNPNAAILSVTFLRWCIALELRWRGA